MSVWNYRERWGSLSVARPHAESRATELPPPPLFLPMLLLLLLLLLILLLHSPFTAAGSAAGSARQAAQNYPCTIRCVSTITRAPQQPPRPLIPAYELQEWEREWFTNARQNQQAGIVEGSEGSCWASERRTGWLWIGLPRSPLPKCIACNEDRFVIRE